MECLQGKPQGSGKRSLTNPYKRTAGRSFSMRKAFFFSANCPIRIQPTAPSEFGQLPHQNTANCPIKWNLTLVLFKFTTLTETRTFRNTTARQKRSCQHTGRHAALTSFRISSLRPESSPASSASRLRSSSVRFLPLPHTEVECSP